MASLQNSSSAASFQRTKPAPSTSSAARRAFVPACRTQSPRQKKRIYAAVVGCSRPPTSRRPGSRTPRRWGSFPLRAPRRSPGPRRRRRPSFVLFCASPLWRCSCCVRSAAASVCWCCWGRGSARECQASKVTSSDVLLCCRSAVVCCNECFLYAKPFRCRSHTVLAAGGLLVSYCR